MSVVGSLSSLQDPTHAVTARATMRRWVGWSGLLALLLVVENGYLLFPAGRDLALRTEETEAARGRRVALRMGCFACHGPDGRGKVPNPGSTLETVPGFTEQTLMMFARNDRDLTAYILDGAPQRRLQNPAYREEMEQQALRMPEFRGSIGDADLTALVAYLRVVSGLLRPPEGAVERGERLSRELGCFSCHGEMGMGGQPNPGSLKGYIPGFLGEDYRELVRSDDELMTWLKEGALPRISQHPIGRYFFERQRIRMPAFGRFVAPEKLQDIAAYVHWLAAGHWRATPLFAPAGGAAPTS